MVTKKLRSYDHHKPWGSEGILEINDCYMMKRLLVTKGHRFSLQYHKRKREAIYVISGSLIIYRR